MKIIVANTWLGKVGNIGFRYQKVCDSDPELYFFGRGVSRLNPKHKSIPMFGNASRLLNAFRLYVYPKFNHRRWDIKIFELSFLLYYVVWLRKLLSETESQNVVLLQETSVFLVKFFKKRGFRIILDVPIAPESYAQEFVKGYGEELGITFNPYMYGLQCRVLNSVDEIIVPSEFVRKWVVKIVDVAVPISVIPFGADRNISLCELELPTGGVDFYFAGNVDRRKGVDDLLEAWREFDEDHRLHLCGRVTPAYKTHIEGYGYKNIILPGFVNFNEYIKYPGVYVFPSRLEGSSKSIYEAMAAGLPVICTEESGSIVVDDLNGFLIEKCSSVELAAAMRKLVNDRSLILTFGKKGVSIVASYTWDRYTQFVQKIMRGPVE